MSWRSDQISITRLLVIFHNCNILTTINLFWYVTWFFKNYSWIYITDINRSYRLWNLFLPNISEHWTLNIDSVWRCEDGSFVCFVKTASDLTTRYEKPNFFFSDLFVVVAIWKKRRDNKNQNKEIYFLVTSCCNERNIKLKI